MPLLVALEGKSPREAYLLSYVAGVLFFEGLFYWIWTVPGWNVIDSLLVHAIYLPQYVALWGLGLSWIRKRTSLPLALVAPPLWVTAEYLQGNMSFLSLPWMYLGHSQYAQPALIQVTSLTGVYGVSFLIVLTNAAIAGVLVHVRCQRSASSAWPLLPRPLLLSIAAAGGLLVATLLYGFSLLSKGAADESVTIALVQGNIPQNHRWDRQYRQQVLSRHRDLTVRAAQQAPQLIIWPETAVPGDVKHQPDLKGAVAQIAIETKSHLLVGSAENAKFTDRNVKGKYYNSVVLFTPEGEIAAEYRKIALVPFAEYVPLRDLVKWPKVIVDSMGNLLPGNQYSLFTVADVPFRAVICWEIIFPDLFRQFVKEGAKFMVVVTNEAWFGATSAPYQLLAMTAFRAAENRVPIARSANTGISALIDPFGRIIQRVRGPDQKDLFVEGVLAGQIPLAREKTFYTQHGDMFAFLQISLSALTLLLALKRAWLIPSDSHGA